jgi:hypothetical protein
MTLPEWPMGLGSPGPKAMTLPEWPIGLGSPGPSVAAEIIMGNAEKASTPVRIARRGRVKFFTKGLRGADALV